MQKDSPLRQVFDLVTGNQVDWSPLPEPFERFSYPGFDFNVTGDLSRSEWGMTADPVMISDKVKLLIAARIELPAQAK